MGNVINLDVYRVLERNLEHKTLIVLDKNTNTLFGRAGGSKKTEEYMVSIIELLESMNTRC